MTLLHSTNNELAVFVISSEPQLGHFDVKFVSKGLNLVSHSLQVHIAPSVFPATEKSVQGLLTVNKSCFGISSTLILLMSPKFLLLTHASYNCLICFSDFGNIHFSFFESHAILLLCKYSTISSFVFCSTSVFILCLCNAS